MAERENLRAEREGRTILRADVAELRERVETPSDGGARYAGAKAQLRDRHLATLLREPADDCQTARERRHEIRVAGERPNLIRGRHGGGHGPGLAASRAVGAARSG